MSAVKVLTAEDIEKADDRKIEPVDVPEWGGRVFVRSMTAAERERFEESLPRDDDGTVKDGANLRARMVAATCCNEKGELLFTLAKTEMLSRKNAAPITRIADAGTALNRTSRGAVADEKKDSAGTPSAGSPTGSA